MHTSCPTRYHLQHDLGGAASLWCREMIDPRQLSQCFSSTSLEGVTSSAVFGISATVSVSPPPPAPRHWPHFTEGSPHRINIAHNGGRTTFHWTSAPWSPGPPPTICGHLGAVLLTQWTVIAVALRWVPPSTVGAIAGLWWWDSTAEYD